MDAAGAGPASARRAGSSWASAIVLVFMQFQVNLLHTPGRHAQIREPVTPETGVAGAGADALGLLAADMAACSRYACAEAPIGDRLGAGAAAISGKLVATATAGGAPVAASHMLLNLVKRYLGLL